MFLIELLIVILDGMLNKNLKDITKARIKIANLLCKTFAVSLTGLVTLDHFHTVCVEVFNGIERLYMKTDDPHYHTLVSIYLFKSFLLFFFQKPEYFTAEKHFFWKF